MNTPEPIYLARILVMLVLVPVLFMLPGFLLLRCWVRLRRESSFLIALATALCAAGYGAWRGYQFSELLHDSRAEETMALMVAGTVLLVLFAVPFFIKLYRAWTGIHVSPEEQAPGAAGVRAWLSPGNLIVATLIAICATAAFDCQFLGVVALLVGCLLIQPLVNTMGAGNLVSNNPESSHSAEREKVLSLLEAGRITAEESADLLNALGSSTSQPVAARLSPRRRMVLIGAGLVLLGFFLPWFSVNPGKELNRMGGQVQEQIQGFAENLPHDMQGMPDLSGFGGQMKTPTVHISGGDIGKGLGWLVLLLGLGTGALPYVATTMDSAAQRMISFIALGVGGIVLLWLVSQNLRFLNVGVILALAGYVTEFLGLLNPRPQPAATVVAMEGRV